MLQLRFTLGFLPSLVAGFIQVNYPLNLQLPPIAHVDAAYQFQFASTTFQSDSSKLVYSLVGNPSWLSLDSNTRTLSGMPHVDDVGETSFTIKAAGAGGAVANMQTKLLISTSKSMSPKANISQILASAGQLSAPRTMIIGPSKPFTISFPLDSFDSNGDLVSYSALLSDRTPLPAWISLDTSSLRFSGTTPPVASSQSFDIVLIASKTPGYTESSIQFSIVVSNHQLAFQPFSENVQLQKGTDVHISDIKNRLLLDGVPISDRDLQLVTAKLPAWLKLDNSTSEIYGKAPSDLMSQDITVTAKDQFGDVAQLSIYLTFASELFASSISPLNITTGTDFRYRIPNETLVRDDEIITIDFSSLSNYLHFDPATLTISGKIPRDYTAQSVKCSVKATSKDRSLEDTQVFDVTVTNAEEGTGNTSNARPAGDADPFEPNQQPDRRQAGLIVGSVIGAIMGILFLFALALCLRHRKRRQSYVSPKLEISRPIMPYRMPDIDLNEDHDLEEGKDEKDSVLGRTREHLPKLDLDLLADQEDSQSLTDSIGDADTRILDSFDGSSFGIQNDVAPSQHPHGSMKIPTELAKRASQKSDTFRKHKRRTTTVYQDQIHRSNGLPVNRRITGMGHGRHTYSPSRSNGNITRPVLHRPRSTSSYTTTRCTSILSTAPSALPQPPVARKHLTKVTNPMEARRSIRIVPASIRGSLLDRRTIDEKRSSYIRKRASAQSPFFSAGGTRESSSSYKSPPAFITEAQASSQTSACPIKASAIVRPTDDIEDDANRVRSGISRIQTRSAIAVPEASKRQFPGSLRKSRIQRPFTTVTSRRDRVEKSYSRPELTSFSSTGMRRRASTRESYRAYELKTSLNNLTGSEIFKDADLSDSIYTDEEEDIKEAERQTMTPGQFSLLPLKVDARRHSKRNSVEKQKRASLGESRWGLKRTSERDPTPYYMAATHEHGGKENESSSYTLGSRISPIRNDLKRETIAVSSPERPKPAPVPPRPASDVHKAKRGSAGRIFQGPIHQESTKERHSRRSMHSRNQSRQSGISKKNREHSRTQSTAYPYFDAASIDVKRSSIGNAITTAADAVCMPESNTKSSLVTRDLSGNLTFYNNLDEEPTIEELRSSSIGFRTSNGQISPIARQSRLTSLHESSHLLPQPQPPAKSKKRETTIHAPVPAPSNSASVKPSGLGLFPVDTRAELVTGERQRTPLSTLQGENQEEKEEKMANDTGKGRQTWGSLKSIMGRGSRWVSGGYWEKQGNDDKVFI